MQGRSCKTANVLQWQLGVTCISFFYIEGQLMSEA